jgi:ABC-2 type transport system permease protein
LTVAASIHMNAALQQLRISLTLHYRNKMALLYSYLFPLIFLLAFWVLYRHESVTLARHMGELLTVSVLGGACFGLPTTMVSERERGVWRRYRLAPVSTATLVMSTIAARYVILITAGLLQLGAALAVGMPVPSRPLDLFVVFAFVSFAFIGLGLVMAMMADTVPAVQALGQCIFLPMLIIGGIAVPLASLPDWAQHVSEFFPGRYAVEAFQACVVGAGLGTVGFDLLALLIIGIGGSVAGAKMFRWDAQQRFSRRSGKAWIAVALISWAVVGTLSEYRGRIAASTRPGAEKQAQTAPSSTPAALPPVAAPKPLPVTLSDAEKKAGPPASAPPASTRAASGPPAAPARKPEATTEAAPHPAQTAWQAVTLADIDRDLIFDRLPSDSGIVTPIAPEDEAPDPDTSDHLQYIREMLPSWQPGKAADPVQRVRNILYVAAVPDVLQMPIERFAPYAVFERLQQDVPKDQLIKILYWIALHPADGEDKAVDELWALRFPNGPVDMQQTRDRTAIYAVKLLGRLLGKLPRPSS